LFHRILQNRIRDVQRRRTVRSRVLSFFGGTASEDEFDPIAEAPAPRSENPLEQVTADDAMQALERELRLLPPRQREAFTLRNFEGLDVAQTAVAMSCTEGSVKTHYSRAVHRLREVLAEHGEEHWND
jgi:RNA polymerase sigma-70 factor (ECF subfamily)